MLRPCMPVTAPSGKRTPAGAYRRRTPQIQAAGCRARPLQLSPSGLSRGPILPRHRASPERSGVRLGHGLPGREPGNDSLKCRDDSLECGARCVRQGRTRRWLRPLDITRMYAEVATATTEMHTQGENMHHPHLALLLEAFRVHEQHTTESSPAQPDDT